MRRAAKDRLVFPAAPVSIFLVPRLFEVAVRAVRTDHKARTVLLAPLARLA